MQLTAAVTRLMNREILRHKYLFIKDLTQTMLQKISFGKVVPDFSNDCK